MNQTKLLGRPGRIEPYPRVGRQETGLTAASFYALVLPTAAALGLMVSIPLINSRAAPLIGQTIIDVRLATGSPTFGATSVQPTEGVVCFGAPFAMCAVAIRRALPKQVRKRLTLILDGIGSDATSRIFIGLLAVCLASMVYAVLLNLACLDATVARLVSSSLFKASSPWGAAGLEFWLVGVLGYFATFLPQAALALWLETFLNVWITPVPRTTAQGRRPRIGS